MSIFKLFFKVLRSVLPLIIMWFCIPYFFMGMQLELLGEDAGGFVNSSADIGIILEDDGEAAGRFCEFLESRHNVTYYEEYDETKFRNLLYYTVEACVIRIPEDFSERLGAKDREEIYEIIYIHPMNGKTLVQTDGEEFIRLSRTYVAAGYPSGEAAAMAAEDLETGAKAQLLGSDKGDQEDARTYMYFLLVPFGITCINFMALSNVLTVINKKDTADRISASSMSSLRRLIQVLLASVLLILGIWVIIILIGIPMTGRGYEGLSWYYVLNTLSYTLLMTAFSVFISIFGLSQDVLHFIGNFVSLVMSFLCGVFVDVELLGESVRSVARLLPMYWYEENVRLLYNTGEAGGEYFMNMGIQLMFGLFFVALTAAVMSCRNAGFLRKKA